MTGSRRRTAALALSIMLTFLTAAGFAGAGAQAEVTGGWERIASGGIGEPPVMVAVPMAEFNGSLYFYIPFMEDGGEEGGGEEEFGGAAASVPFRVNGYAASEGYEGPGVPVWRYDGSRFVKAAPDGFGDRNNTSVMPSVVYRGHLYAGTGNEANGGRLYRTADGRSWERVGASVFNDPHDRECFPLGVQDGRLLVGFMNHHDGCRVWSYDGSRFTRANTDGFGDSDLIGFTNGITFKGRVHLAAMAYREDKPVRLLAYKGGTTWEDTAEPGFGDNGNRGAYILYSDGETLAVGTENENTGGQAWLYDGRTWRRVGDYGMGSARNNVLFPFPWRGKLYVGAARFEDGPPVGTSRLYRQRSDGSFVKWGQDGFGDTGNALVAVGTVFRGDFIAVTMNMTGAQVWRHPLLPSDTYYFAEGTTRSNEADGEFDTWLCVQNPNGSEVEVNVTYMFAGDSGRDNVEKVYRVPANSRFTVDVRGDVGTNEDVSIKVVGKDPVVAERPMYFNYKGKWSGGHVVAGVPAPRDTWYFAEGTTRDNPRDGTYHEWLCIQNPGDIGADVKLTYMLGDGTTSEVGLSVPARSRHTQFVNRDVGADRDVAVRIESSVPVVAERPMYFNYKGKWAGGHNTVGAAGPSNSFYFAEGCTYPWMEEWLCIQNPGREPATVSLFYQVAGEEEMTGEVLIPPTSRRTLSVPGAVGLNRDVSVRLESDNPVVAERPMYFNYQGRWTGGHTVTGLEEPRKRFYFAEGTTRSSGGGNSFEEWICLQNPGSETADVTVTFMRADGTIDRHPVTVAPRGRHTVSVNRVLGENVDASVLVESGTPVVAERPMYFLYHGKWAGGSNTVGVTGH